MLTVRVNWISAKCQLTLSLKAKICWFFCINPLLIFKKGYYYQVIVNGPSFCVYVSFSWLNRISPAYVCRWTPAFPRCAPHQTRSCGCVFRLKGVSFVVGSIPVKQLHEGLLAYFYLFSAEYQSALRRENDLSTKLQRGISSSLSFLSSCPSKKNLQCGISSLGDENCSSNFQSVLITSGNFLLLLGQ